MKKTKKQKDFTVKIKWSLLERIAEFYQFPIDVFTGSSKYFKEAKTQRDLLKKKAYEFEREVRDLIEKYWGSDS